MENLCSSFFSFTGLAGVGGGVITVTLSCPCPSPRHANIPCCSPRFVSLTLGDSLTGSCLLEYPCIYYGIGDHRKH